MPIARSMAQPADLPAPPSGPAPDERYALFLDIDGTLAPLRDRPDDVRIPPALIDLLAHLRRRLQGALAILSGRAITDIDRLLSPETFSASGQHGLEIRHPDGERWAAAEPAAVRLALESMRAIGRRQPSLLLENKGLGIALHYRQCPELGEETQARVEAAAAGLGDGFVVQRGDQMVELRLAGADKGIALASLMARTPFHGRLPIVLGDDLTDERAFDRARALGGIGVIVGPRRPTCAGYALHGPAEVAAWLHGLLGPSDREREAMTPH